MRFYIFQCDQYCTYIVFSAAIELPCTSWRMETHAHIRAHTRTRISNYTFVHALVHSFTQRHLRMRTCRHAQGCLHTKLHNSTCTLMHAHTQKHTRLNIFTIASRLRNLQKISPAELLLYIQCTHLSAEPL